MKKFLPYIIILIALVGLFGSAGRAQAAGNGCTGTDANGASTPAGCVINGTCTIYTTSYFEDGTVNNSNVVVETAVRIPEADCTAKAAAKGPGYHSGWVAESLPGSQAAIAAANGGKSAFENEMEGQSCTNLLNFDIGWCGTKFLYYVIYTPAAFLLTVSATFFNALIVISLSSKLFTSSGFLSSGWAVARDLSNIFFILILLYIAIKLILGLGGSEVKKMITYVIIMALLINFSMFFTQVVIDSSNILALVFYNKMGVNQKDANGQVTERPYIGATGSTEKDISGGMFAKFDATKTLQPAFFTQLKTETKNEKLPAGIMSGVILVAVAVMLFAIYCFFVAGISFLARLIELFVLIIFSPFAFMSFSVPILAGVEYIGWNSWFKRLLKVAFMAPIFMFFLYFIFLLINSPIFGGMLTSQDWKQTLLLVLIPAGMILILLLKATEFAKKGSGVIGEKLMTGAKMIGGLALGAATGGTAFLASNTAGRLGRNIANNDELKARAAAGDKGAQRKLTLANSFANKSFDIRQTGLGKLAAKQSGMDFNAGLGAVGLGTENLKGGRKERDKEAVEKHEEKVKSYELSKSGAIKQDERARQYDEDKKAARAYAVARGADFNEKEFEEDYEKGVAGEKRNYGLNKTVEVGSVKNAKQVNGDRRKAYAYSLEYPNAKIDKNGDITKDENGNVVREKIRKGLGSSFVSGMAGMATNPAGLALAVATAGLAIPLGGLAAVIKDLVKTQAQQRIPLFTEQREIIAGVRKGPDDYKEWLKKVQKDLKDGGSSATTNPPKSPPPAGPAPATGGASTPPHHP